MVLQPRVDVARSLSAIGNENETATTNATGTGIATENGSGIEIGTGIEAPDTTIATIMMGIMGVTRTRIVSASEKGTASVREIETGTGSASTNVTVETSGMVGMSVSAGKLRKNVDMGGTGRRCHHMWMKRRLTMEGPDMKGTRKASVALIGPIVNALKKYVGYNNGTPVALTCLQRARYDPDIQESRGERREHGERSRRAETPEEGEI